ncbi:ATP-dependent DNA helicase [Caldalkalibacillus mannanilyticus]|uniref:ATP-dependent DNA helicase n=1 Tax=Caldalkalibacillus mannanilyticus TaxID=1418 RepID=UPI000B17D31F|nr:ATP-dependent DNA helicase [Caldalkalibacillus mannanilyticus]
MNRKLPFQIDKTKTIYEQISDWVGDVFYDILPEAGFELRDEQIYMAFQLEKAYKEKSVLFAEAGVGTGKTIAYLLYTLCYARYTGRAAIIACADDILIEQLVKPGGDIDKLSKALHINMDARLAKSHEHYLCLEKLNDARANEEGADALHEIYHQLPSFVTKQETMQSFHHYGDRKEYPNLTDEEWQKINWDTFRDCFSCPERQRCGLTLTRDYYKKAQDFIICSHDFFMEHVWTYDARMREGQLPLLPEASVIVFDEGHLLEIAAQKALTYRMKEETVEKLLERMLKFNIREEFAYLIEDTIQENMLFYSLLRKHSQAVKGSERREVMMNAELIHSTKQLFQYLEQIGNELVIESELYSMEEYEQKVIEEYIDSCSYSLSLLANQSNAIFWLEEHQDQVTLVLMPRKVEEILHQHVFSKKIPILFSSATLSENKSFELMARSLGISQYQSFTVESPFDYEQNMKVFIPSFTESDGWFHKFEMVRKFLIQEGGRGLILFPSPEELQAFKEQNTLFDAPFPFYYEGDMERSELVQLFQQHEESVLCSSRLWEGLDIPGPSLTHVIIWDLPYPPKDPVYNAKRKEAHDPYWEVDVPYMLLRLRQGIGRLIRTSTDHGTVTIVSQDLKENPRLLERVTAVLPAGVPIEPSFFIKE